jgi:vacuolar-type H+-ATPase subunit H
MKLKGNKAETRKQETGRSDFIPPPSSLNPPGVCLTFKGASIPSETAMADESQDIIGLVRAAEAEAAEVVKRAEEERLQAVAQAERQAKAAVVEARERCNREHDAALAKAATEAAELQSEAQAEAEAAARAVQVVPEERLDKAADLLVENLRRQWQ